MIQRMGKFRCQSIYTRSYEQLRIIYSGFVDKIYLAGLNKIPNMDI